MSPVCGRGGGGGCWRTTRHWAVGVPTHRFAALLLVCLAACGTDEAPSACGSAGGALDRQAKLEVREGFGGNAKLPSGSILAVPEGLAGSQVYFDLTILNTASKVNHEPLTINKVSSDKGYVKCFVRQDTGPTPHCEDVVLPPVVPAGARISCSPPNAVNKVRLIIQVTRPQDGSGVGATLNVQTSVGNHVLHLATKPGKAELLFGPPTLDFGTVELGQTTSLTFSVYNPGDADLILTGLEVALADPEAYNLEFLGVIYPGGQVANFAEAPVAVPAGQAPIATVTYRPFDTNADGAHIRFFRAGGPPGVLTLQGNVAVP